MFAGDINASELKPYDCKPHLVLLGAGASRAAFPNGEKNGKKLPLMDDFVETIGIQDLASRSGTAWQGRNFERFYADLHADSSKTSLRQQVDERVFHYFVNLEIPDEPCLYDYLVLSLREKDIIATFNWDPFLKQQSRNQSA
jgi:hypothetical protein